jgi:hypothetical protein
VYDDRVRVGIIDISASFENRDSAELFLEVIIEARRRYISKETTWFRTAVYEIKEECAEIIVLDSRLEKH